MIDMFHRFVIGACLLAFAVILSAVVYSLARYAWSKLKGRFRGGHALAMLAFAAVCTWAAQKVVNRVDIVVINSDPTRPTLTANSSRIDIDVTNETQMAYLNFNIHPMVAANANYYLDYRKKGQTNASDWVNFAAFHVNAEYPLPREIPIPWELQSTNYNWVVYTDWVPGPAIVTNGVWHAYWGMSTNRINIIPVNTAIMFDDERITPEATEGDMLQRLFIETTTQETEE